VISQCQNSCTDVKKTIFEREKQSSKEAVITMLNCLKNSKESWFGMFKEALKVTGKFTLINSFSLKLNTEIGIMLIYLFIY